MINNIPEGEKVIIGADLNAHLGEGGEGYRRIHGGEGYGKRNAEGQQSLESLEGLDMAVLLLLLRSPCQTSWMVSLM